MASLLSLFNRLLPFATPGTPLYQDLAHLAAICLFLYYAPHIQDWKRQQTSTSPPAGTTNDTETIDAVETNGPLEDAGTNVNAPVEQPRLGVPAEPIPAIVNGHAHAPAESHVNGHVEQAVEEEDESDDNDEPETASGANGSTQRNIGAKKAKSLARKDQRRAYNEFMRAEGEAQRARDAEGAAQREATLEAEKQRRALIEAELVAKKAKEREQKREAEQKERDSEYRRREHAVAIVKADLASHNLSDLHRVARQVGGDVDEEWVEKVIHASGIVGRKDDVLTIITTTGWAAHISESDARAFYAQAAVANISDEHGYMDDGKVSELLVGQLSQKPASVTT